MIIKTWEGRRELEYTVHVGLTLTHSNWSKWQSPLPAQQYTCTQTHTK